MTTPEMRQPLIDAYKESMKSADVVIYDGHAGRSLDYSGVLRIARALREQIDWDVVRERSGESAYAKAFFVLVEELGVAPAVQQTR